VRHVVHGHDESLIALPQTAVGDCARQRQAKNKDGGSRGRDRQRFRIEREGVDSARRIRNDRDGGHRDEVKRQNAQRQQQHRHELLQSAAVAHGHDHGGCGECHARDDGYGQQARQPGHPAGHLERPHAGEMHGGNADADHGPAERRAPRVRTADGEAEAKTRNDHREDQRKPGKADVIGRRHARFVGQHSDEMRGPNTATGGEAGERQPTNAGLSFVGPSMTQQLEADETREQTNKNREPDQAQIVLSRETTDNAIHQAQSPPVARAAPFGPTAPAALTPSCVAPIVNGGSTRPFGMPQRFRYLQPCGDKLRSKTATCRI
jgi:hypothetical protein